MMYAAFLQVQVVPRDLLELDVCSEYAKIHEIVFNCK